MRIRASHWDHSGLPRIIMEQEPDRWLEWKAAVGPRGATIIQRIEDFFSREYGALPQRALAPLDRNSLRETADRLPVMELAIPLIWTRPDIWKHLSDLLLYALILLRPDRLEVDTRYWRDTTAMYVNLNNIVRISERETVVPVTLLEMQRDIGTLKSALLKHWLEPLKLDDASIAGLGKRVWPPRPDLYTPEWLSRLDTVMDVVVSNALAIQENGYPAPLDQLYVSEDPFDGLTEFREGVWSMLRGSGSRDAADPWPTLLKKFALDVVHARWSEVVFDESLFEPLKTLDEYQTNPGADPSKLEAVRARLLDDQAVENARRSLRDVTAPVLLVRRAVELALFMAGKFANPSVIRRASIPPQLPLIPSSGTESEEEEKTETESEESPPAPASSGGIDSDEEESASSSGMGKGEETESEEEEATASEEERPAPPRAPASSGGIGEIESDEEESPLTSPRRAPSVPASSGGIHELSGDETETESEEEEPSPHMPQLPPAPASGGGIGEVESDEEKSPETTPRPAPPRAPASSGGIGEVEADEDDIWDAWKSAASPDVQALIEYMRSYLRLQFAGTLPDHALERYRKHLDEILNQDQVESMATMMEVLWSSFPWKELPELFLYRVVNVRPMVRRPDDWFTQHADRWTRAAILYRNLRQLAVDHMGNPLIVLGPGQDVRLTELPAPETDSESSRQVSTLRFMVMRFWLRGLDWSDEMIQEINQSFWTNIRTGSHDTHTSHWLNELERVILVMVNDTIVMHERGLDVNLRDWFMSTVFHDPIKDLLEPFKEGVWKRLKDDRGDQLFDLLRRFSLRVLHQRWVEVDLALFLPHWLALDRYDFASDALDGEIVQALNSAVQVDLVRDQLAQVSREYLVTEALDRTLVTAGLGKNPPILVMRDDPRHLPTLPRPPLPGEPAPVPVPSRPPQLPVPRALLPPLRPRSPAGPPRRPKTRPPVPPLPTIPPAPAPAPVEPTPPVRRRRTPRPAREPEPVPLPRVRPRAPSPAMSDDDDDGDDKDEDGDDGLGDDDIIYDEFDYLNERPELQTVEEFKREVAALTVDRYVSYFDIDHALDVATYVEARKNDSLRLRMVIATAALRMPLSWRTEMRILPLLTPDRLLSVEKLGFKFTRAWINVARYIVPRRLRLAFDLLGPEQPGHRELVLIYSSLQRAAVGLWLYWLGRSAIDSTWVSDPDGRLTLDTSVIQLPVPSPAIAEVSVNSNRWFRLSSTNGVPMLQGVLVIDGTAYNLQETDHGMKQIYNETNTAVDPHLQALHWIARGDIRELYLDLDHVQHLLHVVRELVRKPWPPALERGIGAILDDPTRRADVFALVEMLETPGTRASREMRERLERGELSHLYSGDAYSH